ncbi:UDP-2,3-diacylglucosamine diphosphatase [Pontibacter saemangeumensis]|uniref:UDP-2,3-diacylglucosamine diphosphatase n=1 Tax=Pontibacter saemangeumensis TaxID=1084525 RepID=A0ABP8LPS3_9BACT
MTFRINELLPGKKVYFASDFHLGVPDAETSKAREQKIVRWLEMARQDAAAVLLVGDIFDFWFEYKHAIPKGYARLQGKLAELTDSGIPVLLFTGNHDMWMFDYFPTELNIPVLREPISTTFGNKTFYIGHGDGLGPGDHTYKLLKRVFNNKACQWLFARLHPNLGIGVANMWSRRSRISNNKKDESFLGEDEWLLQYCREVEGTRHHDFYVFGHRHLPLDLPIGEHSRYMNLGEWVNFCTYAVYDGDTLQLKTFEG